VPAEQVADRCGLDPTLLAEADAVVNQAYAVIRYGQLCHEYYPGGDASSDAPSEVFSTTKTLGALVTGIAAYETRDLPRDGRKTGPLSDEDRVDHWLDEFTFNPDAQVAHVLGMVAQNADLSFGHKKHQYDTVGAVQINRLSDVINTAIRQDPEPVRSALARRGAAERLDELLEADERRRELNTRIDRVRAEQNKLSGEIESAAKAGKR